MGNLNSTYLTDTYTKIAKNLLVTSGFSTSDENLDTIVETIVSHNGRIMAQTIGHDEGISKYNALSKFEKYEIDMNVYRDWSSQLEKQLRSNFKVYDEKLDIIVKTGNDICSLAFLYGVLLSYADLSKNADIKRCSDVFLDDISKSYILYEKANNRLKEIFSKK
ncbi:hypothetical protein HN510_00705 [Candidatus Woesearchaeota archaeon]|nr:hypothetical protein [Candidatus Woesearchaeota archaeon]